MQSSQERRICSPPLNMHSNGGGWSRWSEDWQRVHTVHRALVWLCTSLMAISLAFAKSNVLMSLLPDSFMWNGFWSKFHTWTPEASNIHIERMLTVTDDNSKHRPWTHTSQTYVRTSYTCKYFQAEGMQYFYTYKCFMQTSLERRPQ